MNGIWYIVPNLTILILTKTNVNYSRIIIIIIFNLVLLVLSILQSPSFVHHNNVLICGSFDNNKINNQPKNHFSVLVALIIVFEQHGEDSFRTRKRVDKEAPCSKSCKKKGEETIKR